MLKIPSSGDYSTKRTSKEGINSVSVGEGQDRRVVVEKFGNMSLFISIEGFDGTGKSTQASILKNLDDLSIDSILVREPGSTSFSEKIRKFNRKYWNWNINRVTFISSIKIWIS